MANGKMTPGPWTVEDREERLVIWGNTDNRPEVASVDLLPVDDDDATFLSEQEANARAIAAVPELIEALQGLVADLPRCEFFNAVDGYVYHSENGVTVHGIGNRVVDTKCAWCSARAALAKAVSP